MTGILKPTLVYFVKRQGPDEDKPEFLLDVAIVEASEGCNYDFEHRMRQTFRDSKVSDIDCQNISRKQFVVSTIEDGYIKLYSLSYDNGSL